MPAEQRKGRDERYLEWLVAYLNERDPAGLVRIALTYVLEDEYQPEAERIAPLLAADPTVEQLAAATRDIFKEMLGWPFDVSEFVAIAEMMIEEWNRVGLDG